MSISFTNLSANNISSASNSFTYSNSSWTPPTSGLIIAVVENFTGSTESVEPTMSGNGITWVKIASRSNTTSGDKQRVTLFGANASGSSAGATTVDFGAESQNVCNVSFFSADGVDLSGGVAAAFVQAPTDYVSSSSPSISLSAAGNSANRPIVAFGNINARTATPRTNWTEAADLNGGGDASGTYLETQYRTDAFETTASATLSGAGETVMIAAELKAVTSTNYPITAAAGAFTLSGQSVSLKIGRKMIGALGELTLSGQAVILRYGRKVVMDVGAFVLTGQTVALRIGKGLTMALGTFLLTGQTVLFHITGSIVMAVGSFVLTGQNVSLKIGRKMVAAVGSFLLTGQDLIFRVGKGMIASVGAFTLTGLDILFALKRKIFLLVGAFTLTGNPIIFLKNGSTVAWNALIKSTVSVMSNTSKNISVWINRLKT